jgi:hypothetical protein
MDTKIPHLFGRWTLLKNCQKSSTVAVAFCVFVHVETTLEDFISPDVTDITSTDSFCFDVTVL